MTSLAKYCEKERNVEKLFEIDKCNNEKC